MNIKNGHIPRLFRRFEANPILSAADMPYACNTVFNCGATRLGNGETLLLLRVEDLRGISHFTAARSRDGFTNWRIDPEPTLMPDETDDSDEKWGIEDPRIIFLPELEKYAILYTGYAEQGPHVKLSLTTDFEHFEKLGSVMPPEDKDASLFPRKFDGRWVMIHRPVSVFSGSADMWISHSPDLKHWGSHAVMMCARSGAWWDARRIGLSPPPIETKDGWLVLYHGVRHTPAGCIYRLGAALFDLNNPLKLLHRGGNWIFSPETEYEIMGDVGNVVFPCGWTIEEDKDTLIIYYGAADTSIAIATASISEILSWLRTQTTK